MESIGDDPTPDQARAALERAAASRDAVRYPPMPWWFYPLMAPLVGLLFVVQGFSGSSAAFFLVLLAIILLGLRAWLLRPGVAWAAFDLRDVLPMLIAFAVLWVLALALDTTWMWVTGAVLAIAVVALTGWRYERAARDRPGSRPTGGSGDAAR